IERIRLKDKEIAIEGEFALPPLAQLSGEDQVFVAAFVRCHGSIKKMEQFFGVSYPTIKNRLNRIGGKLDFVNIETAPGDTDVLDRLESGELSVEEALRELKKGE
ncbi:DUF2089 family protein, partial [candidate division GN15 bacterium]|nr:DUF2089 family protein [candidate division GN15 bacterium]